MTNSPLLRFCSGVTLLSTTRKGADRLKSCRRSCIADRVLYQKYLAVVDSFPRLPTTLETVDSVLERIDRREDTPGKNHVEVSAFD